MFEDEIETLRVQFEKAGEGLSFSDVGHEGVLNQRATDLTERFVVLHLAIMKHTLNTLELAIDQIPICVEVTQTMYFYQNDIVYNPDFWVEEDLVNGLLLNNNRKMSLADMQYIGAIINGVIFPFRDDYQDREGSDLNRIDLVTRFGHLATRVDEENYVIYNLEDRVKQGMTLFDEDQRPDIKEMGTAEKALKALHLKSAVKAELAIEQNVYAAQFLIAAIQLVQSRGCPENTPLNKEDMLTELKGRLGLVMERFDALQDTCDNRHGFTQLCFE